MEFPTECIPYRMAIISLESPFSQSLSFSAITISNLAFPKSSLPSHAFTFSLTHLSTLRFSRLSISVIYYPSKGYKTTIFGNNQLRGCGNYRNWISYTLDPLFGRLLCPLFTSRGRQRTPPSFLFPIPIYPIILLLLHVQGCAD